MVCNLGMGRCRLSSWPLSCGRLQWWFYMYSVIGNWRRKRVWRKIEGHIRGKMHQNCIPDAFIETQCIHLTWNVCWIQQRRIMRWNNILHYGDCWAASEKYKQHWDKNVHNFESWLTRLVWLHQISTIRWRPKTSHLNHLAFFHSPKLQKHLLAMLLWGLGKLQPGKYITWVFQVRNSWLGVFFFAGYLTKVPWTVKCLTLNFLRLPCHSTVPLEELGTSSPHPTTNSPSPLIHSLVNSSPAIESQHKLGTF